MSLQATKPVRRELEQREKYADYRTDLREDFNGCCGYCDDSDANVDRISFHIDHFAPKVKFSHLATEYSNLVYACRFCNNRKYNYWIGDDPKIANDGTTGLVDPCDDQYHDHLERSSDGAIFAKTVLGEFMIGRLNLGLLRHQVLWNSRRSRELRQEIGPLIARHKAAGLPSSESYVALLERYVELSEEIDKYELLAING